MSTFIQISSSGSSGGRFGIADSSGTYTYYTSLTAAMTAAVAGQTIEMFTDYTEMGGFTITLKNGVTINGNGHTYNVTNAGASDVFETTVAGIYRIYNLIVNRTNATGGYVLNAKNYVASIHYFDGSSFTTNQGGIYSGSANVVQKFYNGNVTISGNLPGLSGLQDNSFYNFNVRATSTSSGTCCSAQNIYNSTLDHEGSGDCLRNGSAYNTTIIARGSGYPCRSTSFVNNCTLVSFATSGTYVNCNEFNNCTIVSNGSYGIYTEATTYFRNCTITSTANYGSVNGNLFNCSIFSTANVAVYKSQGETDNCAIFCRWNNASGHAAYPFNGLVFKNNDFKVTNASANCIFSPSGITIKYAQNSFEGATTPINANITQGMINTDDAYGNITI